MGDIDIIHYKTYLIFVNQIIVITLSDHYKPSGQPDCESYQFHTTCICPFNQRTVIDHCIIEAKSAREIIRFITVSFQNTARNITAQTTLAYQIHRLSFLNFTNSFSQFIYRYVFESINMPHAEFTYSSHI